MTYILPPSDDDDMKREPCNGFKNFAMMIPSGATKIKRYPKFRGWAILWIGKWVGFRKYEQVIPTRHDKIIHFMWWKLVKPIPAPYSFRSWNIPSFKVDEMKTFTEKYGNENFLEHRERMGRDAPPKEEGAV